MKRDMALIRKILFFLEARTFLKAELDLPIEGYERDIIRYHILLLAQAGLIDFEPEKTKGGRIIRAHVPELSIGLVTSSLIQYDQRKSGRNY